MIDIYQRDVLAVWEMTLRCNLSCRHCGSRAGAARPDELDTAAALDLVGQLADVGVSEVGLIGGEAFLRRDWETIAAAIVDAGMLCTMVTGAWGLGPGLASRIQDAGISLVAVSIDGLESTHDQLRGRQGSWRQCFRAIEALREAGVIVTANTQINRLSAPELPQLYNRLRAARVAAWQVQLTVPMGNAVDEHRILLQPYELLEVFPMLARVARRAWNDGVRFLPAGNVGYYGPYERVLRGSAGHGWEFWQGSYAGMRTLGIEADGSIKPDAALPSADYTAGNVRERPLREILDSPIMRMNGAAGTAEGERHLWGFCGSCVFSTLCRGGDPWTAHVFFGRRGNNPYCHHRALEHRKHGLRERLELVEAAPGRPFDTGRFSLTVEPLDPPRSVPAGLTADQIMWPEDWPAEEALTPSYPDPPRRPASPRPPAPVDAPLPRDDWPERTELLRALVAAKKQLDRAEIDPDSTQARPVAPPGNPERADL